MLAHRLLLPAAKEKSRGFGLPVAVLRYQSLDDFGNLLLLTTWQPARGLEHQLQPAFGCLFPGLGGFVEASLVNGVSLDDP